MVDPQGVTLSLDQIAANPGDLLIRGPQFWTALPPGHPDQVLISQGANQPPLWADLVIGAQGPMITSSDNSALSTTGPATKGNLIIPTLALNVTKIFAYIDPLGVASFKAMIFSLNGLIIQTIFFDGPVFTFSSTGIIGVVWNLPTPLTLVPGTRYVPAIVRTDLLPGSVLQMRSSPTFLQGFPADDLQGRVTLSSTAPATGDTVTDVSGTGTYSINLVYIA